MGPPILAPVLFAISGSLGLIAAFLRREDDPEVANMPGAHDTRESPRSAWMTLLPQSITKETRMLEHDIREGQFQKRMAAAMACAACSQRQWRPSPPMPSSCRCRALLRRLPRWEFTTAAFNWLTRTDGRTSDRAVAAAAACLPGVVRLADLGCFSLTVLATLIGRGVDLLCRFPDHPLVICADAPGVAVGGCPLGSMLATERGSGWIGRSPSARPPAFPVACCCMQSVT